MKSPRFYPLIGFVLIVIIMWSTFQGTNEYTDQVYYDKIGLELNGIVTSQLNIKYGHGYNITTIDILESNIKE